MIEVERIEPGLYTYHWVGLVSLQDEGRTAFEKLKAENKGQPYVAIIDLHKLNRIPTDIVTMRALIREEINEGLLGYVVCGATRAVEAFAKPLSVLAPTQYRFAPDCDTARQQARALRQAATSTPTEAPSPPKSGGYRVDWYLPGKVIYAQLHHQLEGDEPKQIDDQLCAMLDTIEGGYLIMDLREITEMRDPSVARLDPIKYRHHDHLAWVIYLTHMQLMAFLTSTVAQMAHKNFRVFSAVDELDQFLKRNLPDEDWEHIAFTIHA